jgi:hypothetical protein
MLDAASEERFITPLKFALMVEELVHTSKLGYIESVLQVCDDSSIDMSDATRLINTPLKAKIEAEAVENNYIKSSSSGRLPV